MENFIVSARKYRPTTFDSVVGQSSLTTTLKNAIKNKQLAHAYLFCGPRGVGKTTCARIFAKTINCQNLSTDIEACDQCASCVSFNEQRSFNIHELDAASNNGVDDIRSLIEQVRIPPQVGKYSVYIIDEVHMLSQGAYNAFLKTLEEPPAHAIFILATTEKHKIIPTILSRCQIYDFNRITIADTVAHLKYVATKEGVSIDENALNIIAHKSDGGMRDALSIFDQLVSFSGNDIKYEDVITNLNVLDYNYYFRLTTAFLNNDIVNALLIFNEVLNKGFDAHHFVSGLSSHFRDLLVSKDPQTIGLMEVGADIGKQYHQQAQEAPIAFLIQALKINNDCDLNYRMSNNKRLLVELTMIRICQLTEKKTPIIDEQKPAIKPIETDTKQPIAKSVEAVKPVEAVKQQAVVAESKKETATPSVSQAEPVAMKAPETKQISDLPISISIASSARKTKQETNVNVVKEALSEYYAEADFLKAWKDYIHNIPSKTSLISFIRNNDPIRLKEHTYEVVFSNVFQENDFKKDLTKISTYFHEKLKNSAIKFVTKVVEDKESFRKSSPEESLKMMSEKNPALKMLRDNLSLELD